MAETVLAGNADEMLAGLDLSDEIREGVRPGVEVMIAAIAADGSLNEEGRVRADALLKDNLRRLSEIDQTRRRHPEIADVVIDRPVFILGLPRCGTSLLHALIGADDSVRTPMSWEVAAPSPPPEAATFHSDPRIKAFDDYVDANFTGKWADVRKAHPIGATIPQECGMILETSFQSVNPLMMFRMPDYYRWYLETDTTFAYQVHKMWLQHLSWHNPRERWVLKVQEHSYHLPELFKVYPDAMLVQPHRDPVTVMASISRLIEVIRSVSVDHQDRAELGNEFLHLWHDAQVRMIAFRKARPELPILDMRYRDIPANPAKAVAAVYAFAGIEFTPAAEKSVLAWLADNPADKHGRHTYSLEDYGLTAERVREVYADYIEAYRDYI